MIIKLVSYNGTNINDGTNYRGFISSDIKLQGDARIVNVDRSGRRPVYAAKVLNDYDITIAIECLGTLESQIDALKALFDVEDETPRQLVVKDTADSDKNWYVYATVRSMPTLKNKTVYINLSIADPVWYSSTENSDTWNITASGQKKDLTAAGNKPARPVFTLTPTSAGTGRFAYRRLAIWYNPITDAQINYPLMVTNSVWDTAALVADVTNSVVLNGAIADDATTITWDGETGTLPASGMAYLGTEQISYTGKRLRS